MRIQGFAICHASFIKGSTFEDLNRLPDTERNWPTVIDDFKPANLEQAKFVNDDILKVWVNVQDGGEYRANYVFGKFHPQTPRIITANAENLDEWLGYKVSPTCKPILRRLWIFTWTPGLCTVNREKLAEMTSEVKQNRSDASARFKRKFANCS